LTERATGGASSTAVPPVRRGKRPQHRCEDRLIRRAGGQAQLDLPLQVLHANDELAESQAQGIELLDAPRRASRRAPEAIRLMAVERVRGGERPFSVVASFGFHRTTIVTE
jgi:hypothetical protein